MSEPSEAAKAKARVFILPEPVDPLVEVVRTLDGSWTTEQVANHIAERLRSGLAQRGGRIVFGDEA